MSATNKSRLIRRRISLLAALSFLMCMVAPMLDAYAAAPVIAWVSSPVRVGETFTIAGSGFSAGAKVNFFVTSSAGSINWGPLTPATITPSSLSIKAPAYIPLGAGVVVLQVINTDMGYAVSNSQPVLLAGSAAAGVPTLNSINGVGLAATSVNPAYVQDNVETIVPQGSVVTLGGENFDTANGVAVDIFCACGGGKVGPFFINPGDARLSAGAISLMLPALGTDALPVGPATFVVSNRGADGSYAKKSNAVSAVIGQHIHVFQVTQAGKTLTVNGTGFSSLTVINFYNSQPGGVVNLGGFGAAGVAIPLTLVSNTQIRFAVPAGALPGPSYVEAINPPFVPFASSGNDAGGAFVLTAGGSIATPTPTPRPSATPTPPGGFKTPTPTPGGATATPKATATPAPDENYHMLLTGGIDTSPAGVPLASAELYDEHAAAFTTTAPMAYARVGHSSTVLNDGTILIAGGHNAFSVRAMPSAELYDTRTATFSFTGTMNSSRLNHAAVLLGGGKVLVAGGQNLDFSPIDLVEIYDPATGQFTPTASMQTPRIAPAAAVLKDGRVLIAGGANDSGLLANAEVYDPAGAGSVAVGRMNAVRQGATATLLPNGNVLIAGGTSQPAGSTAGASATAELFNPLTGNFALTGSMHAPRRGHSATLLANGTVLIAGGENDATGAVWTTAEIYDPAKGAFAQTGSMSLPRAEHAAALLGSGKVLVAGGLTGAGTVTKSAEIFDPATGKFTAAANMVSARAAYGMGCFETASPSRAFANLRATGFHGAAMAPR